MNMAYSELIRFSRLKRIRRFLKAWHPFTLCSAKAQKEDTMKNNRMFFKCRTCGNIVGMIEDAGSPIVCCGQAMTLLTANTEDAAKEKHVPVATRTSAGIDVCIGEIPHPATEAHHISWITLAGENWTQRISLKHTEEAKASFLTQDEGPVSVYAYCNLHGLWATELR